MGRDLLYIMWSQDVPRSKKTMLVVGHEARCARIREQVSDLSTGEGRTPKTRKIIGTTLNAEVEVGGYSYEFRDMVSTNAIRFG